MNNENNEQNPPKKRSLTSVTLGWIAEKVRKAEQIKAQVQSGTYKISSEKVAAAIINDDQ